MTGLRISVSMMISPGLAPHEVTNDKADMTGVDIHAI